LDFKGPLEVEHRRVFPFAVLDDHSRYLLTLAPCLDCTMQTAWDLLGHAFAEAGLPQAILSDNAFGTRGQNALGVSWFEARLIRRGIHSWHGRPYHLQTQGKVERFNGTLQRELWPRARRDSLAHFRADLQHWRTEVYNLVRPHEALADCPPSSAGAPVPGPARPRYPPSATPPGRYSARS